MTYANTSQLCRAEHIDRKLITAAAKLGLAGINPNKTINWDILKVELEKNKDALQATIREKKSKEEIITEGKALDNRIKELEIKKREGTYIDPEDWMQWHSQFGSKLSTAIKSVRTTLMSKCLGYESIVDSEMLSLFGLITKEIEKCKQK